MTSKKDDPSEAIRERRLLWRRQGNPVPVILRALDGSADLCHGWVVDRSPDGIGVMADHALAPGIRVHLQPFLGSPRWFDADIKQCRPDGTLWLLGCQFVRPLSSDELSIFS